MPTSVATPSLFCAETRASACRCIILTAFFFVVARLQVCLLYQDVVLNSGRISRASQAVQLTKHAMAAAFLGKETTGVCDTPSPWGALFAHT